MYILSSQECGMIDMTNEVDCRTIYNFMALCLDM